MNCTMIVSNKENCSQNISLMECKEFFRFVIACLTVVCCRGGCDLNKFIESNIVPDIIENQPDGPLEVDFDGYQVDCGSYVLRGLATNAPSLSYPADDEKLYTLIMIDPDAPTPQNATLSPIRHWIIENIPGNNVNEGHVASNYRNPKPPPNSDAHRYILLIYEQFGIAKLNDEYGQQPAINFDFDNFLQSRHLQGPVAGNFFFVKHEF